MANRKNTSAQKIAQDILALAKIKAEEDRIESKTTHVGFVDASARVKLAYKSEALDELILKERERMADGALLP